MIAVILKKPAKRVKKIKEDIFYDLGIRNSLIQNFNSLDSRNDLGPLWENFCAIDRLKAQDYNRKSSNNYF